MAEETVLKYLTDMNRPFNITNVVDALQSTGYKKAQLQKALDTLSESGRITCTENGKQKIYLALQTQSDVPPEQVREEEVVVAELGRRLDIVKRENAALAAELRALGASQTTEQMVAATAVLEAESAAMEAKLAAMEDGGAAANPEERAAAEATARACFDAWTSRRRKFKDCYDALLEGTEKKDSVLKEEVGFEDDAAAGADYAGCKAALEAVTAAARRAKQANLG